jgi:hypothetical protein
VGCSDASACRLRRGFGGLFVFMSMGVAVVMLVTTMLVMVVMIMVVMMAVIVTAMIVFGMIVACMAVRFVPVIIAGIGAAFRIERGFDLDHPRPQPLHHAFDDVIAANSQGAPCDLRRQVAVTKMPGDANQMLRIVAANFKQRLRRRHDLDQPAILQHQRIASAQRHGMFEIQQELEPARPRHRHPPPVAVVEIEHDRIRRRLAPALQFRNFRGADHRSQYMK